MKHIDYLKTLNPEQLAHELGGGRRFGENHGCDDCECKSDDGGCEGCDAAWLLALDEDVPENDA